MKNILHTTISVFLSAVVFCTGIGATVTNYCCPDCEISYSLLGEKLQCNKARHLHMTPSCCHKQSTDDCAGSHTTSGTTCCYTSRISVDLYSHLAKPQIKVPFVWLLSPVNLVDACQLPCGFKSACNPLFEKGPPLMPGKDYLAIIQVFII